MMDDAMLDELALSYAKAAPFIEEGKQRLHMQLDAAFCKLAEGLALERPEWALAPEDNGHRFSYAPQETGRQVFSVRWNWDDSLGKAYLRGAFDEGAIGWIADLLDANDEEVGQDLVSFGSELSEELAILGANAQLDLNTKLRSMVRSVEQDWRTTLEGSQLLGELQTRPKLPALFYGRDPWGKGDWAVFRNVLARAVARREMVLDVKFVNDAVSLDSVSEWLSDSPPAFVVFEGAKEPPAWAHKDASDATADKLHETVKNGALAVVIGDWIDVDAWNADDAVWGLLPVTIAGRSHKDEPWEGAFHLADATAPTETDWPLDFSRATDVKIGGATRSTVKNGAEALATVDSGRGSAFPLIALRRSDEGNCLWLATSTGGWGAKLNTDCEPWMKFVEAVVDFAIRTRE